MIQRRQQLGFAVEACHALHVARKLVRQNLNSDAAPQPRILRQVHLAHPTRAKRGTDLIGPKFSTGRQGHNCARL